MIQLENLPALARKYKGAPLACLWVLMTCHQRVTQSYLESMTGYTDKTISSALQYLKEDGLIDHQPTGWMISSGTQLQLPSYFQDVESRRISDPISSSESINLFDELITTNYSRNNSDIWDLLESAGVYHNQVTDQLASKLTANQVRMAIRQLSLENKPLPANAGLLISRLKHPIKYKTDEEIAHEKYRKYEEWEK